MNQPALVAIVSAVLASVLYACDPHIADPQTVAAPWTQSVLQFSRRHATPFQTKPSVHDCAAMGDMLAVIPLPRHIERMPGSLPLPGSVTISANGQPAHSVASLVAVQLQSLGLRVVDGESISRPTIRLTVDDTATGDPEGYRLTVDGSGVSISAAKNAGLFYGVQTLEQILSRSGRRACSIPYVTIVDSPEYRWRGIHLDVSRHFFSVAAVERYIDLAARYKLNTFHWHLTDDQGWRMEIRSRPALTSVGGCRDGTQIGGYESGLSDDIHVCGFYTQAQIRDVVAYAQARFVTVVPEIEGPGHSVEVLAAYPELACSPGTFSPLTLWGSTKYSLCPTEKTFAFYDDVIREMRALFPSTMIHIGGDEVPRFSWRTSDYVQSLMRREHLQTYSAVQGYFTRRIESIAHRYNRRIVGWDEIESAGVSQDAVVMAWSGYEAGRIAAHRGNDVVMTPHPLLYFDGYQGDPAHEPPAIGGLSATPTTLQDVYAFDPTPPELAANERAHILGAQGNLWTEYVPNESHLWYMAFPKVLALAELCWTPRAQMNWDNFTQRLSPNLLRLETERIQFRPPEVGYHVVPAVVTAIPVERETTVALESLVPDATIRYTTDGTAPTSASHVYRHVLHFAPTEGDVHVGAIAMLSDGSMSAPSFFTLSRR